MARSNQPGREPDRVIVGISGASGVVIGLKLLKALEDLSAERHLVVTRAGEMTIGLEAGLTRRQLKNSTDFLYAENDIAAAIASGSFRCRGMVVAPCSVRSWSEIAAGTTGNLLTRAADVTLKERKPLILIARESPLHLGHLRSLAQLAEMGAVILPPVPAFYAAPHTLEEMVDQIVGRALDHLGYDWPLVRRWGEDLTKGRRRRNQPKH
ncbi:MAG: UbiX family flavin prenyltransferase [Alphaproteobacteria bacterium]|nr:UbiX family flavin prenyltransferase [Alphaproteobacteria bacterium]